MWCNRQQLQSTHAFKCYRRNSGKSYRVFQHTNQGYCAEKFQLAVAYHEIWRTTTRLPHCDHCAGNKRGLWRHLSRTCYATPLQPARCIVTSHKIWITTSHDACLCDNGHCHVTPMWKQPVEEQRRESVASNGKSSRPWLPMWEVRRWRSISQVWWPWHAGAIPLKIHAQLGITESTGICGWTSLWSVCDSRP